MRSRAGIASLVLGLVMVAAVVVVIRWHPWDPRLGRRATERALPAYVHRPARFTCRRTENDGSIDLRDVDYTCESRESYVGYWVATDGDRITAVQPMG
jgi:hypothetical protein